MDDYIEGTHSTENTPLITSTNDDLRPQYTSKLSRRPLEYVFAGFTILLLVVSYLNFYSKSSTNEVQSINFNAMEKSEVFHDNIIDTSPNENGVKNPFYCGLTNHESGYIKLPHKKDDHYFYLFVQSRSETPDKDPLVLWLTGGPGCSSMLALLAENGPCHVQPDLTTKLNPYAWNQQANVIWLDQPTNVGFSYGASTDYDSDEINVGENIYWFLQGFLKEHPDFVDRPFFITGESYGGHYVPAAAREIISHNIKLRNMNPQNLVHILLAGISIGNGITMPAVQYMYSVDMAFNSYDIPLLTEDQIEDMRAAQPVCHRLIRECQKSYLESLTSDRSLCKKARHYCSQNLEDPYMYAGVNPYDIRQPCDEEDVMKCFHFGHIDEYLNDPDVLKMLNVNTKRAKPWRECDDTVFDKFGLDELLSLGDDVAFALDAGVRVLIYAGDADLMCNWVGNHAWTVALEWSGTEEFSAAGMKNFATSEVAEAGQVQSYQGFTFIRIYNAGHMVPMDQPSVSLDMINKFFKNESF